MSQPRRVEVPAGRLPLRTEPATRAVLEGWLLPMLVTRIPARSEPWTLGPAPPGQGKKQVRRKRRKKRARRRRR